jgi:hypothetical protein
MVNVTGSEFAALSDGFADAPADGLAADGLDDALELELELPHALRATTNSEAKATPAIFDFQVFIFTPPI